MGAQLICCKGLSLEAVGWSIDPLVLIPPTTDISCDVPYHSFLMQLYHFIQILIINFEWRSTLLHKSFLFHSRELHNQIRDQSLLTFNVLGVSQDCGLPLLVLTFSLISLFLVYKSFFPLTSFQPIRIMNHSFKNIGFIFF